MGVVVDFETYCELNLRGKPSPGVWAYAEHPSCEILCLAYKIGGDSTEVWTPPDPFPPALIAAIEAGDVFEAHNAQFERAIWLNLLSGQTTACFYGSKYKLSDKPIPMPKKWRDTMAVCAYKSLPLSLDEVTRVLDLKNKKDPNGEVMLRRLSRPRKPSKEFPETRNPYHRGKAEGWWDALYAYCKQDVEAEYELSQRLGWLPVEEASVWVMDQRINQRGIAVDLPAVQAIRGVAAELNEHLTAELRQLTGDPDMSGKKVAKFLEWLREHGAQLPDLQKETVEDWLQKIDRTEHPEVYRALEIRQQTGINSVAKVDAILSVASRDGRMRGLMQYHGSGTGRWAGRHFQPQNIPRPTAVNAYDSKGRPYLNMDSLIYHMRQGYNIVELLYSDVAEALISSLRGALIAGEGKRLYVSDFSAIEARVTMWLAGQDDKVEAFRAYDRHEGPDIYCVAAQDLYNKPINKADHPNERQLGKIQILGCGYQMSGKKLHVTAQKQGVNITPEQADWLVQTYRKSNARVPQLWYGLQDAATQALTTGKEVDCRGIVFHAIEDRAGPWLTCRLPSGRKLWYFDPKIEKIVDWDGNPRWNISYAGRDNKRGGTWGVVRTYGGMLTENVVQAISRCLLVAAMTRVENHGYPIVLTVHDEIISETDYSFGDIRTYDQLVAGPNPDWADGLPVAAEGWTGTRYRKG